MKYRYWWTFFIAGVSGNKFYTVAIALERFFVINFPLVAHRVVTVKRSKGFALGVMIFSVLLSCFSYLYQNYIDANSFDIYTAIVLQFIPFLIVLVLNIFILIGMHRYKAARKSVRKSKSSNSDEESITKMLLAVIIVFGVCSSFEFVRRIMIYVWPEYMSKWTHYDYTINHLADIFHVLNSSLNFLIYCLFGSKFRSVFLEMFKLPWGKAEEVITAASTDSSASKSKNESTGTRSRINSDD
ncbi:unnamed protein product [Orchesella dallaii]|uniref:G-protein coupled receptors family 1 profile domain-containing protein n=1 Tax=Orchesella dallaii TaxID=48710 RepID=A0ABP1Q120_9HEXA